MADFGGFSTGDAYEIHRRVLGTPTFSQKALDVKKELTIFNKMYYVVMQSDLAAATDAYTGYTQANGKVVRYVQPNNNTLDMEDAVNDDSVFTVTNRFTTYSAVTGDLVLIMRNGSEWTPVVPGAGSSIIHCRVTCDLGQGYYKATIGTRPAFSFPKDDAQTGTGCFDTGTGTCPTDGDSCGTSLPGECPPAGSGVDRELPLIGETSVYIYDPRRVNLSIPGHALIVDMGDTIVDFYNLGMDTGTGTGTGCPTATLYMVLSGTYDIVEIPDKHYECCPDGSIKLIRCDTYIVEGMLCVGIEDPCTIGTGTGT